MIWRPLLLTALALSAPYSGTKRKAPPRVIAVDDAPALAPKPRAPSREVRFARGRAAVRAPFSGGKVKWDGVEEGSGGRGGLGGFMLGEHTGSLPALSFTVFLEDGTGHTGVGGLQLAGRIEDGRLMNVPPDSLLTDDAAINRAVHLALDSLPIAFRP